MGFVTEYMTRRMSIQSLLTTRMGDGWELAIVASEKVGCCWVVRCPRGYHLMYPWRLMTGFRSYDETLPDRLWGIRKSTARRRRNN